MMKVLAIVGICPEVVKLAPILQKLEWKGPRFQTIDVTSAQHTHLLHPYINQFGISNWMTSVVHQNGLTPDQGLAKLFP